MIRLELLGAHTRVHATLCNACPQGPAGCCASPPGVEWSDLGRIVSLGGTTWLLDQLAAGNLKRGGRALNIRRREADAAGPRRCVFHEGQGCTIPADRRAATCNFYVCDDAFARAGEARDGTEIDAGRRAVDLLMDAHGRWDLEIAERVRERWPEGPPWDTTLLAWLGEEYARLVKRERRALRSLRVWPAFAVQPLPLSQGASPPPGAGSKFRHLHPQFRGPNPETPSRLTEKRSASHAVKTRGDGRSPVPLPDDRAPAPGPHLGDSVWTSSCSLSGTARLLALEPGE